MFCIKEGSYMFNQHGLLLWLLWIFERGPEGKSCWDQHIFLMEGHCDNKGAKDCLKQSWPEIRLILTAITIQRKFEKRSFTWMINTVRCGLELITGPTIKLGTMVTKSTPVSFATLQAAFSESLCNTSTKVEDCKVLLSPILQDITCARYWINLDMTCHANNTYISYSPVPAGMLKVKLAWLGLHGGMIDWPKFFSFLLAPSTRPVIQGRLKYGWLDLYTVLAFLSSRPKSRNCI